MIAADAPSSSRSKGWWGIVAVTAVAAGIRFYGLDRRQLWLDENCTFYWARHFFNWPADGPQPWYEPAHLPYFFLLHGWCKIVGDSAWGLRSFSALIGTLTVPLLSYLAFRLAGRRAAITTAILAALHPLHVYYSQEARSYSLWIFITTINILLLLLAANSRKIIWWIVYVCAAWLAVLTHFCSLFWIPGSLAVIFLSLTPRLFLKRWIIAHILLGLMLIPVYWWCLRPYLGTGAADWQHSMWLNIPPHMAIPKSLWSLLPSGDYPSAYLAPLAASLDYQILLPSRIPRMGPAILLCAIALACLYPFRSKKKIQIDRRVQGDLLIQNLSRPFVALAIFSLSFLAISWIASFILGRGYLVARYDFAAWPSFILALVLLLEIFAHRFQAVTARRFSPLPITAFLAGCSAITCLGLHRLPVQNDILDRASRIAAQVQPEDLLISLNIYRWFLEHEWEKIGFKTRILSFPSAHDRQFCWQNAEDELRHPDRLSSDASHLANEVEATLQAHHNVWLISHGQPVGARWNADQILFQELRGRGISIELQNEWIGLAVLGRRQERPIGPSSQRP
ncbi:MAG: glycosyltransferase family 39 protein [Planctomycetota bacterium]